MGKFMDVFPAKIYDAIPVTLIHEGNVIRPEPELSSFEKEIDKLRLYLGVSIAYLIDRAGPVDVPRVQIAHNPEAKNDEYYAVLINGNGAYRDYYSSWDFITHIFQGIEAVCRLPGSMTMKVEIPVLFGFNQENPLGRGKVTRGEKYTDIHLRVNNPMPEEMFNNLLAISFSYLATNPVRNHEFG